MMFLYLANCKSDAYIYAVQKEYMLYLPESKQFNPKQIKNFDHLLCGRD